MPNPPDTSPAARGLEQQPALVVVNRMLSPDVISRCAPARPEGRNSHAGRQRNPARTGWRLALASALVLGITSVTGAPSFTNLWLAPGGIALAGSGGSSNATYHLLSSSSLALPSTNWPAVATNNFDANGNFLLTNPTIAVEPQFFRLRVPPAPAALPDFSLIGFATVNGTVTGGAGGPTQTVTTASAFRSAVGSTSPQVVQVSGTIDLAGSATVRARKTIVGLGTNAAIVGTLNLSGTTVSNVIVRNLTLSTPSGDGITIINGAHHIWVDHCTFYDCADGQLDITQQADFVTVSWCKFNYTTNSGHNFSMLIGSDDSVIADRGKLNVSLHHNWWSTLAIERMPRARFGDIHSFNNFFNSPGNNYCIRAALESEILIENNYFLNVDEPWDLQVTAGSTNGMMQSVGNLLVNCTNTNTPANDTVFTPPYPYTPDPAGNVPGLVTNYAGVGRGPFAP